MPQPPCLVPTALGYFATSNSGQLVRENSAVRTSLGRREAPHLVSQVAFAKIPRLSFMEIPWTPSNKHNTLLVTLPGDQADAGPAALTCHKHWAHSLLNLWYFICPFSLSVADRGVSPKC